MSSIEVAAMRGIMDSLNLTEAKSTDKALVAIEDSVVKLGEVDKLLGSIPMDDALYQFDAEHGTTCQRTKEEAMELLKQLRPLVGKIYSAMNK